MYIIYHQKFIKTTVETAQTMANSDSLRLLRQLQIIMSVAFSKSVSKSVYQLGDFPRSQSHSKPNNVTILRVSRNSY